MVPTTALGHESGSRRRIDRALIDRALIDRALTDRALAEHGVACTVAQVVGHTTTIFRMLDAGLGLSVIPTLALPPEGLARLAVRPLVPRVDREIMLVHRRHRALSPVAQAAWDLVRAVAVQRCARTLDKKLDCKRPQAPVGNIFSATE